MNKMDAYHERIGMKAGRHPFTGMGKGSTQCAVCVFSPEHSTHQGAEVVSLAQFRDRKRK